MATFATFRRIRHAPASVALGVSCVGGLVLLAPFLISARGCAGADTLETQPAGITRDPLRIATWNVQKCEGGLDQVVAELRALDADIICLQELIEPRSAGGITNQAAVIAAELEMYAYSCGGQLDHRRNQCLAILASAPLGDMRALYAVANRNFAVTAVVQWRARPLRIVCVHLAGTYKPDLSHVMRSTAERGKDWGELLESTEDWVEPLVVAGDFNMTRTAVLSDLPGRLQRVDGTGRTFPSSKPVLDLDHVLCSRDLRAVHVQTCDTRVSDHRAVLVHLTGPEH